MDFPNVTNSKQAVTSNECLRNIVLIALIMETQLAIPGMALGQASKLTSGPGTHLFNDQVWASISGPYSTSEAPVVSNNAAKRKCLKTISVIRDATTSIATNAPTSNILPAVDSIVLARVTRINPRQATVAILVVDGAVCADSFQGLIRVQDIRATEKDKVKVVESFRPGDVVRAVVISLGDQSNYYLSTARNELGVVMAKSDAGNDMAPASWKEMVDVRTGAKEARKVAKPF